ncbi:MAG: glycoside hydrolase family 127 protein [Clostridia bacterium]|nr:glycoside hydrolase family 127 protein [Clostridia bacterium]
MEKKILDCDISASQAGDETGACKVQDALYRLKDGLYAYSGEMARSIRFIKCEQLKDRKLWKKFVEQFRIQADAKDSGWIGEFWGKMMRGASVVYAYDKDEALYSVLEETIRDMLSTQEPSGRISTYAPEQEFVGWDVWVRKYVMLGMEYFYDICLDGDLKRELLDSLCRQADYILQRIGAEEGKICITDTSTAWGCVNSCSILEAIVWLYKTTKEQRYFDFAEYIVSTGGCKDGNLFTTALENVCKPHEFPARKAYEVTSFFNGLLEMYRVTGDSQYLRAVQNFAKSVKDNDLSIIGCCGCEEELFDNSTLTQTEYRRITQETCVTVTWIQLCYELLCLTGESVYADLIEKSTYNALYSAVNYPKNKEIDFIPDAVEKHVLPFDSYSPLVHNRRGLVPGGYRLLNDNTYYGCCACIGSFGLGLIPQMSVMNDQTGFVFHIYEAGVVHARWGEKKVCFRLETAYPTGDSVRIRVELEEPTELEMKLRSPIWSEQTRCSINGEVCQPPSDGYFRLKREWKTGDEILLTYVAKPKVVEINDKFAVQKGVIVMARDERFGEQIDGRVQLCEQEGEIVWKSVAPTAFAAKDVIELQCADGETVRLCDYASAGTDWKNEKNKITVWMNR